MQAEAQQQNVTTSTFTWPGGPMTVSPGAVVGGPTSSFTGSSNATVKLYISSGTLVYTYTSTSATAASAAANGVTGEVLDNATINFGNISAGSYYLVYTGTKTQKSADFNQYFYAYWSSLPTPKVATTFSLSSTSFTYKGSSQGPNVVASPGGATFTSGGTLSATNAGSYTATATASGMYSGSNSALLWTINKAGQTITFAAPTAQTYGGQLTLSGSASSGLAVVFSVMSGPATLSGNTLTFTGAGSVTIRASQGGNSNYSAASNVDRTFTVNPASATFSLNATSFTYSGLSQAPAVVPNPSNATYTTGGTFAATNAGSYTATATASGNYTGSNMNLNWSITKAGQTLTFANPGNQIYGTSLMLNASASSGLTPGFTVVSGPASLSGNTLSFSGTGAVTVRAAQAGNANYNAAPSIDQAFTVNPASVTFSLDTTSFTYNGSARGPAIVASPSGATFTAGGVLTATTVGSYTATATATGNYSGSNPNLVWMIAPGAQTISFANPGSQSAALPLALSASASSGLTVAFSIVSGPAKKSGNVVTFTGAGSVTIAASQAGDANYGVAATVEQSFQVVKATPSGVFAGKTRYVAGFPSYIVVSGDLDSVFSGPAGAVAEPGGTITYTIVSSGASIAAGSLLPVDSTYVIQASYPGDALYGPLAVTSTWLIAGPSTDTNHDGVPDVIELQLGLGQGTTRQTDSANQTQLKANRPN
jgi:large repetitive protein